MKNSINALLNKIGLKIISTNNWRPKHEYEKIDLTNPIITEIRKNTMLKEWRLSNIKEVTEYLVSHNIKGDFVECGVWKGGSVALMAHYLKEMSQERTLRLFDAFDDICEPDAKVDGERAIKEVGGVENAKGQLKAVSGFYKKKGGSGNEEEVLKLLIQTVGYKKELVHLHKGWFQDTLPLVSKEIKKIALLRLDGDWYASTKVCLDYLYDKVVPGGVIIVDDYGAYEGCKKAVDEFLYFKNIKPYKIKVDNECVYWVKEA
jgi:O-methyltransferase